ncbi:MAG: response regulator transcription factor [Chloroflexi bacterium]|nr:response regulator transcription factor [Chloroflexota bacterium]
MNENIRLLIVDSHQQVRRELAAKLFRRLNPQVVGWADAKDAALRLLSETQAHVVLLDAQIVDSFAICQALVEQQPATKIVVLTSYADEQEKQKAYQSGASAYLLKTIPSEELLSCIEALYAQPTESPTAVRTGLAEAHRKESVAEHK